MKHRGHLATEMRNAKSMTIDRMSIAEAFGLINGEDATVAGAVGSARDEICAAVALVVASLRRGGRLIYVGAGTSGRLGVLDAAECPPTFLTDPGMVRGVIAGGVDAITRSVEGAEDCSAGGVAAMRDVNVSEDDVVFGIATGGTTPFVHGAIAEANQLGARTVFLACVSREQVPDEADVSIRVITGPEVITGSTRMKAGTATKMVLNMVTTISMVQLGKVYENLMVDVNTTVNAKLIDRGTRMIEAVTGVSNDDARTLLMRSDGRVKVALVMHHRGVDAGLAMKLLSEAEGRVGDVLSAACDR